jgi:signal transduction histidine kinase
VDKHKVMQILINLIRNAKYACDDSGRSDKLITLRIAPVAAGVSIAVQDNGIGIPRENMSRLFQHGFTTRASGHGFGLHSCALAALELGGTLRADSDGEGRGACFTLELPLSPPTTGGRAVR